MNPWFARRPAIAMVAWLFLMLASAGCGRGSQERADEPQGKAIAAPLPDISGLRSEERRVGKECRL